jgi:hypothetical protein
MRIAMILTALTASATAWAVAAPDLSVYYGTERASLGVWFGTLTLGTVDAPKLPPGQPGIAVELVRIGHRIDGVNITFPPDSCADVDRRLSHVWGPPNADGGSFGEGWASTSGLQGARFEGNSGFEDVECRLRFFRRVTPAQWLNTSMQSVVPLWAIGRPAAKLEAAIAVLEPARGKNQIEWQDTAIDGSHIKLAAEVDRDQVVRVVVSTEMETNAKQIWQRLLDVFGKPAAATTHEDSVTWRWPRAGVELGTYFDPPPPMLPATAPRPPPPIPTEPRGLPMSISFSRR